MVAPMPGMPPMPQASPLPSATAGSTCLVLGNLFNHQEEEDDDFEEDIKEEVSEQVREKVGNTLVHIFVDKYSPEGKVWMKFADRASADTIDKAMSGRWFAKRKIKTEFVPPSVYKQRCPDAP
eukprot:TRINITY_DN28838_c0_g1_i1.p2 TRINITY_DN28838_c0_g1~~TRINITY_DN28838_c0_g1_i1.p2  ORF type:complete len:130 (+),score=55.05 TRINITY_DN28838_c0_g1_i1:24-392(+)